MRVELFNTFFHSHSFTFRIIESISGLPDPRICAHFNGCGMFFRYYNFPKKKKCSAAPENPKEIDQTFDGYIFPLNYFKEMESTVKNLRRKYLPVNCLIHEWLFSSYH